MVSKDNLNALATKNGLENLATKTDIHKFVYLKRSIREEAWPIQLVDVEKECQGLVFSEWKGTCN